MLEKRLIWLVIAGCALAVVILEAKSEKGGIGQIVGFCFGAVVLVVAAFKNWRLFYRRRRKILH